MKMKKLLPLLLVLSVAWSSQILMAQMVVSDDSDASFSLLGQMVTVTSPNGGENWNTGEAHNITWTLASSVTNVNIDYSTDGGGSWTAVAANAVNSGSYAWTVPATTSSACLMRVSAAENAGNNDFSDRVFSISSSSTETVTAPTQPSGPASGSLGISYAYSSGGANSNFGDALQYKFDWGDGTDSGWLATGTTSATHAWTTAGTFLVKAMARCATHTGVESSWSAALSVNISDGVPGVQWNTFLGANSSDTGWGICTDSDGNVYIVGNSASTWGSPKRAYSGQDDIFVAKLDASGILLWNTFLGSASMDYGRGISVDGSGNVFVTGSSINSWGSPLNPFYGYPSSDGDKDTFVAKLNASGVLQWNTFMGGTGNDAGNDISLDANGNIYITGSSANWGSPLNPYGGGGCDAFVAKLNASGVYQWHTFMGGNNIVDTNSDSGQKIALDESGNIYVAGSSTATWGNPKNPFAGSVVNNYSDAFLARLNASGTREWHTFMGGTLNDYGYGIVADNSGNIYVAGLSNSTWGTPLNPYGGGTNDAFVARFNANGSREWHTFMGGTSYDSGYCIALEKNGYILVTGNSSAAWGNPLNPHSGDGDAFVARLNTNGSLQLNTFLGGILDDKGYGITLDNSGNIFVTGYSYSTWGAPRRSYSNSYDAFVAKLCFYSDTLAVITPNGGEDWAAGSSHTITWNLLSSISSVNIDYSTNNGGSWIPVAANVVNNGVYNWTVPATPSLNCLVRVSDSANGATYDVSDGLFFISASSMESVSAPAQPSGPDTCLINGSYGFSAGGSASSLGHAVQYKFDWGDGSDPVWLAQGTTSAVHSWAVSGTYQVRAMARCATHTGVESPWSVERNITVPAVTTPLLLWNTFMGEGSQGDSGESVTTDSTGNIYIVGDSYATWGSPVNPHSGGSNDAFVAKLNSNGVLLWNTFLGGSSSDNGKDIVVDGNGNIYIVGYSSASWGNPIISYAGGGWDGFVVKLNADGVLQWNTFMGGSSYDSAMSIALDSSGNIYATGASMTSWGNPRNSFSGSNNSFLAKFDNSGARLWHTFFIGTTEIFVKNGITVDSSGNIFVTGYSGSSWGTPLNPFSGWGYDLLVVKFNGSGTRQWHTFLGSRDSYEYGKNITLDGNGNIYVAGRSNASWGSPLNPYGGGTYDGFVAKLNANGIYQWHTFIGGSDEDSVSGIALNQSGDIYVSGDSYMPWGNPLNPSAGYLEGFIAKLNSDGVRQYHTFFGSSKYDRAWGMTLDGIGNIVVTGESQNTWGTPINPHSGNDDAFVVKFGYSAVDLAVTSPNGGENWISGESHNITWCSNGTIANVDIDYSTDSGGNWISVASQIANNNTFSWTVPDTPSANCLVRISNAADASLSDQSNSAFTISPYIPPSITVTSPNGGEDWMVWNSHEITWITAGAVGNVSIDYSIDNGGSWTSIASNITNSGSYTWGIPDTASTNCLVRVSDAVNPSVSDVSNATFTISVVKTITVTSPNGGESWAAGSIHNITWNYTGSIASVNIDYSIDYGSNWSSVVAALANNGSYSWVTPTISSTDCLVRVSNAADSDDYDISDSSFSITVTPTITVISPNGGEQWQRGTTQTIMWASSNVDYVKIQLLKGTSVNLTITSSTPADNGSYSWTIPASQAAATNYKIRITSTASSSVTDSSDAAFSIFAPSITVTAPASGASWQRGLPHTITWTTVGTMDANVKIQLIKGTTVNSTLTTSTPNDGSYDWTIPANQTTGTNYKIRIITVDGLVTGNSGTFSITSSGNLTLLSPNNGECLRATEIFPVSWSVDPDVREVRLEYSRDNGGTYLPIADNVPNNGYFGWKVPVNFTPNGILRVSDTEGKYWYDEEGVLETTLNFSCVGGTDPLSACFSVWFGGDEAKAPGYGFARVVIGLESVRMAETSRAIAPLGSGWHEARIRLDLKHDLGTLFIDGRPVLENAALDASRMLHFEPYLSIQTGGGEAELLLGGLKFEVVLLSAERNELGRFTAVSEDFGGYDAQRNPLAGCWRVSGSRLEGARLEFRPLSGKGQALRLHVPDGGRLTICKPLSIPEIVPFDISDRSFSIEMKQEEE